MVAFTPGFITCNSSYLGTVADVAGKMNCFVRMNDFCFV
jgi:hypothetical protein